MNIQKYLLSATILVLGGCAISPPQPPRPEGEFRPVNAAFCHTLPEAEPVMTDQEVQP